MRRQQIAFTPTALLGAVVARQARRRGLSLSAVVREALLLYFAPEIEALRNSSTREGMNGHLDQRQGATPLADDPRHV